jgi:hypothetical protein
MNNSKDREFFRYELNIPVWLEIEPDVGEPYRERCNIINISQKGILFESKSAYKEGRKLGVRFFLPSFGAPVRGVLKVVWSKEIIPNSLYRIGGEFVELVNADQQQFKIVWENYSNQRAFATVCPKCGYVEEKIILSKEDVKIIEIVKALNKEQKLKALENLGSLLRKKIE